MAIHVFKTEEDDFCSLVGQRVLLINIPY